MKNEKKILVTCIKKGSFNFKIDFKSSKKNEKCVTAFLEKPTNNNMLFFIRKRLTLFPISPLVVTRIYVENES